MFLSHSRNALAQQFLATHIETKGQFQRILRADRDTRLTKTALCGKHTFVVQNVITNANVHRTYFLTSITVITLTCSLPNFDHGETRCDFQRHTNRTDIFAESAVIFQCICQRNTNCIVRQVSNDEPRHGDSPCCACAETEAIDKQQNNAKAQSKVKITDPAKLP